MSLTFALLLFTGCLVFAIFLALRRRSLRRVRSRPFPRAWASMLRRKLPIYSQLPSVLRGELHGLIQVFLHEKNIEGCGGLELNDTIRIIVAAEACLLLVGRRPPRPFPRLDTVLVYPDPYVAGGYERLGQQHVLEVESVRAGESWHRGLVVLSWSDIQEGLRRGDGRQVIFHEFAHQLDQEDGLSDGTPTLDTGESYEEWARTFREEFLNLRHAVEQGWAHLLDSYGATNEAEFFAVATETFFERPCEMRAQHPELYQRLNSYYRLDPAEWCG